MKACLWASTVSRMMVFSTAIKKENNREGVGEERLEKNANNHFTCLFN